MSTLNVANITDGSTTVATEYVVNGSAKAWGNLAGVGTIALRDSLNVSSVTDLGTGNYQFSWSNNMANTDYAPFISRNGNAATGGAFTSEFNNNLTTSADYITRFSSSVADAGAFTGSAYGDLA